MSASCVSSLLAFPRGLRIDSQDCFSGLSRIESCKSLRELKQIHSFIIKTSPASQTQQFMYSKMILICASEFSCPEINYVNSLFDKLSSPDTTLYNAIIRCFSGYKNSNYASLAVLIYCDLLKNGLVPNNFTYPFLLKACAGSFALREGEMVHGHVVKYGLASDLYVVNSLMHLYAVCGVVGAVRKLFDKSPQRDLVSWTALIKGYANSGYWKEGIELFFSMRDTGFLADGRIAVVVLSACAKLGNLTLGKKIHKYLLDHRVKFDVFVENSLVDMYLKCGDAEFAQKIFNDMRVKNVVSWNAMIQGLAQLGEYREALNSFRMMQRRGVKLDDATVVGVVNSCANMGEYGLGKWVHAYMDRNRIKADGFIGNALLDMYAKCGSIDEAFRVFEGMTYRDVYAYTAMIIGFAMHGQGERALELFSEMLKLGLEPNGVTFVGVLTACSHAGLVDEGRKQFEEMLSVYKIQHQIEHYGCMVDILARSGLIREAEEFIGNMPIDPDAVVWGALLGACRIHGNVELAESITQKIRELEPEKDGTYILMSNIYSSQNKWRDALQLRKAMKERKMKKSPGCSSIMVGGTVHEFRQGRKAHPETKEIYASLEEMMGH